MIPFRCLSGHAAIVSEFRITMPIWRTCFHSILLHARHPLWVRESFSLCTITIGISIYIEQERDAVPKLDMSQSWHCHSPHRLKCKLSLRAPKGGSIGLVQIRHVGT